MNDSTDNRRPAPDPALDPELDRFSRRALLQRAGAGAAAAAVLPQGDRAHGAPAHALEDPSIDRRDVTYPSRGANGAEAAVRAFLAAPKTSVPRGGVIVIHEIFGLTDHIRDVTCRLAQAGFTAIAPDLFTREGAPPPLSGGFGPMMEFVNKIPDAQIMSDLDGAAVFVRSQRGANGKVGVVGFCYGGRLSMLFDAHARHLDAAVAYYGRITGAHTANQPKNPIDVASGMRAPLLGNFGAEDHAIPVADVDALRAALADHHKTADLYEYVGAGHAFNNDTRESYRPEAARLAWTRTIEWFRKYLAR